MTTSHPRQAAPPRARLAGLVAQLHAIVGDRHDAAEAAPCVAASLRTRMPTLDLLTTSQRAGDPTQLASRVLHAEDLSSVVALVLRPGQQTTIHDHLTWCVVTVVCGTEHETVYRTTVTTSLRPRARPTRPVRSPHWSRPATSTASATNTALVPPGDIHRVRNESGVTAISLHVYGGDLHTTGSSVRRSYHLPVQ